MTVAGTPMLKTIDASTLKQLLDQDVVTLIDVREAGEYAGERIANSKLFPLSSFDPQKLPVEGNKPFVLLCRSSNRSGQAAQKLLAAGYGEVTHLQGGLIAWTQAGFPVQKNDNAPISIMRQVQMIAGGLVLTGIVLGTFIAPEFLLLSALVGAGLTYAGLSGNCLMAVLLGKLPYNQVK